MTHIAPIIQRTQYTQCLTSVFGSIFYPNVRITVLFHCTFERFFFLLMTYGRIARKQIISLV